METTTTVRVQLVKRFVTDAAYQRQYAKRPGYWPLRHADGGLYVVYRIPVTTHSQVDQWEPLEDWEEELMKGKLS